MAFPRGYNPTPKDGDKDYLPVTGGKVAMHRKNLGIVARGIWKKPTLNLKWLKRAKISDGGHGPTDNEHCIMEAFSVATGQGFGAGPICVADTITEVLINANDTRKSDRERARFKKVVPIIMGTAPIRIIRSHGRLYEEKDYTDKAYREVEKRRQKVIDEWDRRNDASGNYGRNIPTKDYIALVEKLAKMRPKATLKRKAKRVVGRSLIK